MKKTITIACAAFLLAGILFTGCDNADLEDSGTTVTIAAISGVKAPVSGEAGTANISATKQYTGTIGWQPLLVDSKFAEHTQYTATINLNALPDYTFTGVKENFFTVEGAMSAKNDPDSGLVHAVFATTGPDIINLEDPDDPDLSVPGINYTVKKITYVDFQNLAPAGYQLRASWDAMGKDDNDNVYVGFTSLRPDKKEDFAVFSYNHKSGVKKFLGTFMETSRAAGNLHDGEEIPKGHTKLVHVDGKIYMGSQSFHDFKRELTDLPKYRGSHLYCYDIAKGTLSDLSAKLPDGVVTKNEGIIALSYMPSLGYLVGLTHPHSNVVFFDIKTNTAARIAAGIPWEAGKVVARELIVDDANKRVYLRRAPENPGDYGYNHSTATPVYCYDWNTGVLTRTIYAVSNLMWNGQQIPKSGKKAYVSTTGGSINVIDFATSVTAVRGSFVPAGSGMVVTYLYSITLSPDEKKLYAIPTWIEGNSGLYEFDLVTRKSQRIYNLPEGVYCGNGVKDSGMNMYFTYADQWETGHCKLLVIEMGEK
jgi:hypothetical protein